MKEPAVLADLIRIANGVKYFERVRFAVSPQEFADLREYFLYKEDHWFSRIRNVQLVVEEHPEAPLLLLETGTISA